MLLSDFLLQKEKNDDKKTAFPQMERLKASIIKEVRSD